MTPVIEGGDIIVSLAERVLGRVVAQDVVDPASDEVLIPKGTLLDEAWCEDLDTMGVDEDRGAQRDQLRDPARCLLVVLRTRSGAWSSGQSGRGGGRHRRAVDR